MAATVLGVIREGRVVLDSPLPEGARVEVRMAGPPEVPEELLEEFAAWGRASDQALLLAERPSKERAADETR